MISLAPDHSVPRPRSAILSKFSVIVRKWFPANCPALLAKHVGPYASKISVSLTPPGYRIISPGEG